MNNGIARYMALAVMFLAAWAAVHWPPVGDYIASWRPMETTAMKERDKLYDTIVKQAKQYEIPAQDAVIDKVWKATPGYNGLAVDIDASYQNMKKTGMFDERKLVFRQVPRASI
ncbi:hypothetical protein LR69_01851 [Geobacillus sp. BCO2]|nr:hypothetical protein LR69_01851 [Geobacillus sp. BCO2]